VVTQTFTGAQLKDVLEQQFTGYKGQTTDKTLQVSAGLTYACSAGAALGSKVSGLSLGGVPVDPAGPVAPGPANRITRLP
jgi:5'-nucleotidase